MSNKSNDTGRRAIHLTDDMLEFAIENCESNLRVILNAMMTLNPNDNPKDRPMAEKAVNLLEKFKKLKRQLEEGR